MRYKIGCGIVPHNVPYSFAARSGITISFVSIFIHVWILESKST